MKLLVDMNLSPKWIALLHDSGWEAVHWSSVGRADARDSEIMAYAAAKGYVVVTHDLDFGAILAVTHGKKPSVVQIRSEDVSSDIVGRQTVAALRHTQAELEAGALVTIEADRTRLRLLPLERREEQ
jgi:predicted nuclease of predicted toxin-antitoxin system